MYCGGVRLRVVIHRIDEERADAFASVATPLYMMLKYAIPPNHVKHNRTSFSMSSRLCSQIFFQISNRDRLLFYVMRYEEQFEVSLTRVCGLPHKY